MYLDINSATPISLDEIRAAHPLTLIPDGADLSDLGYAQLLETPPPLPAPGEKVQAGAPVYSDGAWRETWHVVPLTEADLEPMRAAVWGRIKAERDRRKGLGVKVGTNWFHSDPDSRIQQIGLTKFIPQGTVWKTLSYTPQPVFVPMTTELAEAIVQATAISDVAIFTAAEVHRMTMEASAAPQDYDFSTGWPVSIEEEANDAGIQFDASVL